jgi:hypothetical protein
MNHIARRREEWRRRAEAAGWVLLCGGTFVALCAAIPQDGRTLDGFLIQLVAALTGYLAVHRWRVSPRLSDSVRYSWAVRHFDWCFGALAVLALGWAALFPLFHRAHATSNRFYTRFHGLSYAFRDLLHDSPDGRMPQMRTRAEARRLVAPYLRPYAEFNSAYFSRRHGPITADWFWQAGETGESWIFNPQVSGLRYEELARDANGPVLAYSPSPVAATPTSAPCRMVVRITGAKCLSEAEWERVRPRW